MKEVYFLEQSKLLTHVYGNGSEHVILFFGGWGTSIPDSYHQTLSKFGDSFRIYAFSLPGFGDNHGVNVSRSEISELASYLGDAIERNPHFGRGKLILMGHSTGAGIASILATRWGAQQVSDLVLVSPIGSPDPLYKSLFRMVKYINWRKVNDRNRNVPKGKWLQRFLVGVDAKRFNMAEYIIQATDNQVRVHLYVDPRDKITPPGVLPELVHPSLMHYVEGGHSWFNNFGVIIADELRLLLSSPSHRIAHSVKNRSMYRYFTDKIKKMLNG